VVQVLWPDARSGAADGAVRVPAPLFGEHAADDLLLTWACLGQDRPPATLAPHPDSELRVYTLGRFALAKHGRALAFPAKAPRKALELLQALIALGGREVHTAQLMWALWADEDSADLRNLFDNTLYRLRRLLDCADALTLRNAKLSLNAHCCWVDAWAFDRLAGEGGDAAQRARQALRLYQDHFLQREAPRPWLLPYRERLRSRFHRLLSAAGRQLQEDGRWREALDLYARGLELDPSGESLYRGLMACHLGLGEPAEALLVYRRCRELLDAVLGVAPSPATEALRCAIARRTPFLHP
jgi:two-component SAPR family response regulator